MAKKARHRGRAAALSLDDFAASLLEEAKRFLEKAESTPDDIARVAFLRIPDVGILCS
jgi:hypothetical protein